MCGAIMSDHWEEISWDRTTLTLANVTLTWYLDGQVAMVDQTHRNHHPGRRPTFLVPMYGGIWIMCVSLTGEWLDEGPRGTASNTLTAVLLKFR